VIRTAARIAAGTCAGLLAAFAVAAFVSTSALAATFTVTNTSSSIVVDGSLPHEIGLANLAGGTNSITFASSANGTITLSGELEITGSPTQTLTITGNGASNTVIDAGSLSRVFEVDSGATLNLSGVTVQNGQAGNLSGGGILVEGSLNISDSSVTGNASAGFGAGVDNFGGGTVTITDTTVSDNDGDGGSGAGAANAYDGTLNIVDSTFVGNHTTNSGGGVFSDSTGTINITDSTFNGNRADEGGAVDASGAGPIDVIDSTLAFNYGDDVSNGGDATITVTGSILADSGYGQSCSAAVTDGGFNIDDGTSCGFSAPYHDLINTNPSLAALAGNGGPTQTMALNSGSPAIDAGQSGSACTSVNDSEDQRGFVRPDVAATACDIGAYEYGAAAPTPTPTPTSTSTSTSTPTSTPAAAATTVPVPTSGAATGSTPAAPWGILAVLGIAGLLLILAELRGRTRRPV